MATSVRSVDEDSSLLYYLSINLAGRLPTNVNSKVRKLRRSSHNNDSRSGECRLRILFKRRIQLVNISKQYTLLQALDALGVSSCEITTDEFFSDGIVAAVCIDIPPQG